MCVFFVRSTRRHVSFMPSCLHARVDLVYVKLPASCLLSEKSKRPKLYRKTNYSERFIIFYVPVQRLPIIVFLHFDVGLRSRSRDHQKQVRGPGRAYNRGTEI